MGRYFKVRSQADLERRLRQGRGQGTGVNYFPWFFVHEVPSRGRSHKIPSLKFNRSHHLLSDLEAFCFRALEQDGRIRQIREQYPLLPLGLSVAVAKSLGIQHPVYPGTKVSQVLTSDFCVDIQLQKEPDQVQEVAIAVKYECDLKKERVRELLAIECETNRVLGRPWFLFTNETLSTVTQSNLSWLWYGAVLADHLNDPLLITHFCTQFQKQYEDAEHLQPLLDRCAKATALNQDDIQNLFKYAVWYDLLLADLTEPIGYQHQFTLARSHQHVLDFAITA